MIRILIGISFLCVTIWSASTKPVYAQDSSDPNAVTDAVLSMFDATQTVTTSSGKCLVAVTSDKDSLIQDVDKFRTNGVLNDSYSDEYFLNNPAILIIVMAFQASSAAIEGFFSANPSTKTCHFQQFLSYTDNYGNSQNQLLFSYDFEKSVSDKINWDKFSAVHIPDVSRNYVETSIMQAMEQLSTESENQQ